MFRSMQEVVLELLEIPDERRRVMSAISSGRQLAESPLESMFWHFMEKTKTEAWERVEPQHKTGHRRLDALLVTGGIRIDLELDGKAWHDKDRDADRDAELLGSGAVDEVIRIEAPAMLYYQYATMLSLSSWYRAFYVRPPSGCMTWQEWLEEKRKHEEQEECCRNPDFDDWCQHSAEVSLVVGDNLAVVGNPILVESYVNRGGKAHRITRKREGFSDEWR